MSLTESPAATKRRQQLERQLDRVGRDTPKGAALLARYAAEARAERNGRSHHVPGSILAVAAVSTGKPNGKAPETVPVAEQFPAGDRLANIPVDQVDVAPNVRTVIDEASIDELAESIKAVGVLQPIKVLETERGGHYQLVYGQRRLLAARRAGLTHVPALVEYQPLERERESRSLEQLIENIQRADLNAIEEARALKQILDHEKGLTQAALAKRVGRSEPWISNALRLLELAAPVRQLIAVGKLSGAHGKVLAGVAKSDQQAIANAAAKEAMSVRQLEAEIGQRRRNSEWQESQRRDEKRRIDAAVKALVDRKVDPASTQIVVVGYQVPGGLIDAIKKAGFKNVNGSGGYFYGTTPGPKFCDCTALRFDCGYSSVQIARHCVKQAHRVAAQEAASAKEDAKRKADDAQREHAKALFKADLEANPVSLTVGRFLVWQRTSNGWEKDKEKKAKWERICSLTAEQLNAELAKDPGYNLPPIDAPAS